MPGRCDDCIRDIGNCTPIPTKLPLKLAQCPHKLPAFDAAVAINVKQLEDVLRVDEVEREAQGVHCGGELANVQIARPIRVPRLERTAHVELSIKDDLRDLADRALDIVVLDAERRPLRRDALQMLDRDGRLTVGVRDHTRAHQIEKLVRLDRLVAIDVEAIEGDAQLRLGDAEANRRRRLAKLIKGNRAVLVAVRVGERLLEDGPVAALLA